MSTFAAAVWQKQKCCALEEYVNKKSNKSRTAKNGRCDLYMLLDDTSYACEAKQAWQKVILGSDGNLETTLDVVKSANDATREISVDEADIRLSLTFCVPYFREKELQQHSNLEETITSNIKEFCNELDHLIKNNQYLCDGRLMYFLKSLGCYKLTMAFFIRALFYLLKKSARVTELKHKQELAQITS